MNDKRIPQFPGLPLLGNMLEFGRDRLAMYARIYEECGDIAGYRLAHLQFVLLNKAEYIQWLLVENHQYFERSPVMEMMRPILGNGLLTSSNALNSEQRKRIAAAFHPEYFPRYGDTIVEQTALFQQTWRDGQCIDLAAAMMHLTLGIIGKTLFSADIFEDLPDMVNAVTTMLQHTDARLKFLLPIPLSWPLPFNQNLRKSIRPVDTIIGRLIAERRAATYKPDDLLTLLIEHFETDREIRDQMITFLFAGHETTANLLTWTYYLLAKHPQLYKKLQDETSTVLNGKRPQFSDLKHLPYSLQILKEVLRLYPPAYAFGRTALRDMELDGYPIKKGTIVIVSPHLLHTRADYFPEPACFLPERFAAEQEAQIPRFGYLPFGAGPRVCIGRQFALMEAHLVLVTLAQSLRFESLNEEPVLAEPMITLRPKTPVMMRVHRIDNTQPEAVTDTEAAFF